MYRAPTELRYVRLVGLVGLGDLPNDLGISSAGEMVAVEGVVLTKLEASVLLTLRGVPSAGLRLIGVRSVGVVLISSVVLLLRDGQRGVR